MTTRQRQTSVSAKQTVGEMTAYDDGREFDLIVWGNEPAGLWLLNQFSKYPGINGPRKLGWIPTQSYPELVLFPSRAASSFQIPLQDAWSADLVTPKRVLTWNQSSLEKVFTHLPKGDWNSALYKSVLSPGSVELSALRHLIRHSPEILGFAQGIWKLVGRCKSLMPENLVWATLMATDLFWWDASLELPQSVIRLAPPNASNELEKVEEPKTEGMIFHFRGLPPLLSKRWLINTPCLYLAKELARVASLNHWMNADVREYPAAALYPLEVAVESLAVPDPVRPATAILDSEEIPDWSSEVWPLHWERAESHLRLWASAPANAPLESCLSQFREGVKRLNRVFPFLPQHLIQFDPSLGLESCHEPETRAKVIADLERRAIEVYGITSHRTETRARAIHLLMPFLNCHLPYPLGTLMSARHLLVQWVGKKQMAKTDMQKIDQQTVAVSP